MVGQLLTSIISTHPQNLSEAWLLGFGLILLFGWQYMADCDQVNPQQQFGELFKAVQLKRIFSDSKTFPDCIPVLAPELIMQAYLCDKDKPGFDLKAFVLQNFKLPAKPATNFVSDPELPVTLHITKLWPILTRPATNNYSSRISLPHPYVVPGGRFREIYYWDSYFTMLGLQVSGENVLIEYMVDNFTYLIYTVGHIPNGNRSYYASRSQPPFYALMLKLLSEIKGDCVWRTYGPALRKEYDFWMEGADSLSEDNNCHRRVVLLPDGSILNRYWDDATGPRPESYIEDVHTGRFCSQNSEDFYQHIRAGAESGWDFSSRWFKDGQTLETIYTCDIIPVDLNCLLYNMEFTLAGIAEITGDPQESAYFQGKALARKKAINKYFWSKKNHFYMDYDFRNNTHTPTFTLAAVYPLFFHLATPDQAEWVAEKIGKDFLKPGGLVNTLSHTLEQWDAPNGWAPLQWLAIKGLRYYGFIGLADRIKERWIHLNIQVYKATGKLVEKYNVEEPESEAGGGEYILQDGFGWTNGVLLNLMSE